MGTRPWPEHQLRQWFGHDPERWQEFQARYHTELAQPEQAQMLDDLAAAARLGPVTLVYGARDREHNQAQVIADEIERRLASTPERQAIGVTSLVAAGKGHAARAPRYLESVSPGPSRRTTQRAACASASSTVRSTSTTACG